MNGRDCNRQTWGLFQEEKRRGQGMGRGTRRGESTTTLHCEGGVLMPARHQGIGETDGGATQHTNYDTARPCTHDTDTGATCVTSYRLGLTAGTDRPSGIDTATKGNLAPKHTPASWYRSKLSATKKSPSLFLLPKHKPRAGNKPISRRRNDGVLHFV